jgi:signal transduction histidine kinase/ActR/RegA family two-component response regulator
MSIATAYSRLLENKPMQSVSSKQAGFVGARTEKRTDVAGSLRSLRLFMLACAGVALLLFLAFAAYRHQQMRTEAEVRLERSLSIAHEHALRVLDTNDTLLRHVLDMTGVEDDAALRRRAGALHESLAAMAHNKPQVQSIWVQGADGRPVATSRFAEPPASMDVSGRPYFQWHRDKRGGMFLSGVMSGARGGRFFNISRGRYLADGSFGGLVSVGLHSDYFTHFHEQLAADEPGLAITLFRADGIVYSRWPALPRASDRMASTSEVLQRVTAGETAGALRSFSSLDGRQRLILFRKLGDYPVYLGIGTELSAIDGRWLRELAGIAAFAVVPVLGIVFAAYLAMKRTREALESARRLEEETVARRQVEDALLQSQKMEALGRLTGGVAHDFNNALMVISGNLHLLKLTQPGAAPKYTDAIGRAVESATKLTRQLLAFSRRQALAPETLQLQERLPAMHDLLAPTLGSKIALQVEVDPGTAPIHVDPAELELALINLAVNARDAMEDGGSFRVEARNDPDGRVCIEAIDTGSGMDPAIAAKAFDPFFTTKPLGKGTGLGLSQVAALCKRAGGDVAMQSTPGAGTRVRMHFPASSLAPAAPGVVQAPRLRFDRSVLLVEDNAEVAAVVLPVLQKLGCRVTHHESGEAAQAWLDAHAGEVELLLTDVVMPGAVDGRALAHEVRSRHPHIRILLMTGYAEQIEAISQQGLDVLPKPFSPRSLGEAMERAFAREPRPAA